MNSDKPKELRSLHDALGRAPDCLARAIRAEATLAAIRAALESDDFKRDVLNRADLRGISLNVSMALNVYRTRLRAILDGKEADDA